MSPDPAPRIATVGVHILDTLGRPVTSLPQGQDSLRLEQIRITPAGTAAGVAVDLATLGGEISTFGAVGKDEAGDFLTTSLRRRGVDTSHISRLDGVQTSASILLIADNGDRPALHVRGANAALRWEDLEVGSLGDSRAVHFGGLDAMPGLDLDQTAARMTALRSAGCLVSLDLQSSARHLNARLLDLLPQVDVFLPNEEQALGLVGGANPQSAAERLVTLGAASTIVTCGADGAVYADENQTLHVSARPVEVVDTTGCGDAFAAAYILATVRGHDLSESLRIASDAAGLVASGLGSDAGLISWEHLLETTRSAPVRVDQARRDQT